jgi:hypothetical protein
MADVVVGGTITVTRSEVQEPNIIDVDLWLAYRVINGVTKALSIETLTEGDGITITEPVGGEGVRTYDISWPHTLEGDIVVGNTYQILFVPGGTEADQAGILDWLSDEYTVVEASTATSSQSNSVDISVRV